MIVITAIMIGTIIAANKLASKWWPPLTGVGVGVGVMELVEEDDDELVAEEESIDEEDKLDVVEVWVFDAVDEDWCVGSCVGNAEVVGVATVGVRVEDVAAEDKGFVWDEDIGFPSVEMEVVEGNAWYSEDVDVVQTGIPLLVVQNWPTSQQNEISAFAQTIAHWGVDAVQTGIPLLVVQIWPTSQQNEFSASAQTTEHRFSWSRSWFGWGTFPQNAARSQRTTWWRELPKGRGVAAASTIVPAPAAPGLRLIM
jgi:hypothetical protein